MNYYNNQPDDDSTASVNRTTHIRMGTRNPNEILTQQNYSERHNNFISNNSSNAINSTSKRRPFEDAMYRNCADLYDNRTYQTTDIYGGTVNSTLSYNLRHQCTVNDDPSYKPTSSDQRSTPLRRHLQTLEPLTEYDHMVGDRQLYQERPTNSSNINNTVYETDIVCGSSSNGDDDEDKVCDADPNATSVSTMVKSNSGTTTAVTSSPCDPPSNTKQMHKNTVNSAGRCSRTSSNNSSFTAGTNTCRRELARFNNLNRSFNQANLDNQISIESRNSVKQKNINMNREADKTDKIQNSAAVTGSSGRSVEDFLNVTKTELLASSGLVRRFSQRVKNQVQSSLSEPLRHHIVAKPSQSCECTSGCDKCLRTHISKCSQQSKRSRRSDSGCDEEKADVSDAKLNNLQNPSPSTLQKTASVRKRVAIISSRLQLPKFLTDGNSDSGAGVISGMEDGGEFVPASSSDESDDAELLDLREREQIVEKYEKGPDGKDVDPWENPDFELYKVTDRFGFVHKTEAALTPEENERRRVQRELKREQKWLRMLEEWKRRHPEKLPNRIWKGIPDKLRLVYWKRLLNVEEMKGSAKPNLYNELLMRARLLSKEVKQIDLDINRTYRDHLAFRRRYDVKQQSLFNVLAAYAMFNTEVGYCQGMSQIAAIFLMYMDEEDAFWCMHSLLANRKYAMHGFFVPGFPKLARFQHHYEKVIQKYLPKLQKHLDKVGIPNIHLTKWWFGCFLDRVPFSLAIRVWDVFLYFGDSILIAMAYNIMKMHKATMIKLQMEGFMDFIQQRLAVNFGYSNDQVMESLEECLRRLQSDRMALPPPPNPSDPSEIPTKPLGPILMRSMVDIRIDIAEIHSRSSRTNSVAGRSPALKRRNQKHSSADPGPRTHTTNTSETNATASTPAPDVSELSSTPTATDAAPSIPADVFSRIPSLKKRPSGARPLRPPPVPDADGFVPMMARKEERSVKERTVSCYDNVVAPPGSANVKENSNNYESRKSVRRPTDNITDTPLPPPDPDTHIEETIMRINSSRISRPAPETALPSTNKSNERQIGTGSLRHKMDGRNLTKVVQMYQEQHKQLQRHLQKLPRDDDDINTSEKTNSIVSRESPGDVSLKIATEKNVRRTPDNVTYIAVNHSTEKEPDLTHDLPSSNVVGESRPRQNEMLPYCPPPDYSLDDDFLTRDVTSIQSNQITGSNILSRTRNAVPGGYATGSLNYHQRRPPPQDPRSANFIHNYPREDTVYTSAGSVNDRQPRLHFKNISYHAHPHNSSHHTVGPTTSQPLGEYSNYYRNRLQQSFHDQSNTDVEAHNWNAAGARYEPPVQWSDRAILDGRTSSIESQITNAARYSPQYREQHEENLIIRRF